jgi:TolA-binding protein
MSKKARSITFVFVGLFSAAAALVVIGLLFSVAAAKVSADESARLEQGKSNIYSLIEQGNFEQAQEQTGKLLADFSRNSALPQALYEIAEKFRWSHISDRDKDKYVYAENTYQQVIASYPDSPFASKAALGIARAKVLYFIIAQDFNSAGQALNEMTATFANDPNLPDELYWIGRGYGYWERHEDEKNTYQLIIQNYPSSQYADRARIGFAKANVQSLIMSKDYDAAEQALDKLISDFSKHPDLPEALYWIAERYNWADKYEDAKALHQTVIQDYPDSSFVEKAKLGYSKAEVLSLISRKEYENAEKSFDKLFTDFEGLPDLPRAASAICEQCCKQGLSKDANDPNQAKDIYGVSVKICDRLISEMPDYSLAPETCRWAGYCCFRLGKFEDSIGYFQKVIDDYPHDEYAWSAQCWLGDCYERLKISGAMPEPNVTDQMEAAYQAVIEKYPDCPSVGYACLKLAGLYFSQKALPEAALYMELFVEKSPVDDPRVPRVLYELGQVYEQMGQLDAAAETYGRFLQAYPENHLAETVKAELKRLARRSSGGLEGVKK